MIGEVIENGIRTMRRGDQDGILLDMQGLVWAVEEGSRSLNVRCPRECVRFQPEIRPPSLTIYHRKTKHRLSGKTIELKHECVPSGTVVTMEIEILNPQEGQPLEAKNVARVLAWVGKWIGISQYGRDMDYGRFEVEELLPKQIEPDGI